MFGLLVKPGLFKVSNSIADAIREVKVPTAVTELRSFLGLQNIFRRFVPNCSRIVSPVSKRLKKTQEMELGSLKEKDRKELDALKENLISPLAPQLPKRRNS